jgi:DNA mismatch repair protein MutS2
MGLPAEVLARARAGAGEERVQIERLLADLDRRARDLAEAEAEARTAADEVAARNAELERRLAGLDRERRDVLADVRRRGDELLREGRQAIEAAVREIRSGGAGTPVVRTARDRLEELAERLPDAGEQAPRDATEFAVGDRVRIPHLGLAARVLEVRGERLVADAEGLRLTVSADAVEPLAGAADGPGAAPAPPTDGGAGRWSWRGDVPAATHEIDLRGERAEDAWERLDRLIDRAIPAGLEVLHVIHGYGTGRLRDELHARLRDDDRVASFREAGPGRGGGGATVVRLADD